MSKFSDSLDSAKNIVVVAHSNPDADAIASCLMVKRWFETNYADKKVDIYLDGKIAELYNPLIKNTEINTSKTINYDTAIVLDCPNLDRVGVYQDIVKNCPTIINIDHHDTNERFGTLNYVVKKASSTGELLYILFDHIKPITDDKIAEYAYHCIITDTNNYSSLSMSKRTHLTLYNILEKNFDASAIKDHYFSNISKSKQYLIKRTINSMRFLADDRLAVMNITYKDMETVNADFSDTLGLVENGLNVSGIDIAIIFIEKEPNVYYVSLRSKHEINVAEIASKFGGGGHNNMAAFEYKTNEARDFKNEVIEECSKILEQYPVSNNDDDIYNY